MPRRGVKTRRVVEKKATEVITEVAAETKPAPRKTGTRQWRSATSGLGNIKAPDGYSARWVAPHNVERRLAEGYEFINKSTCPSAEHTDRKTAGFKGVDGANIGTAITYREMVAMAAPKELVESRTRYFEELTEKRTDAAILATSERRQLMSESRGTSPDLTPHLTIE